MPSISPSCHARCRGRLIGNPRSDLGFEFPRKSMAGRTQFCRIWDIFFLIFVLASWPCRLSALSVTVTDMECVYEYVLFDGDTVSGNFVVDDHGFFLGAGHPGFDLIVSSPTGNSVHSIHGSSGEKFEFKAPSGGLYKFCFRNPNYVPATVSFYIHTGHIPDQHDLAKDEHLNPVNVKIAELREALESVTVEQKYLKAREVRHRRTNESTRRRLIRLSVIEYIELVAASFLQVAYIRRLFSKTLAYNRI